MKKTKKPEDEIRALAADIIQAICRWQRIRDNGCNDPFWTDGTNMNLARNHIIHDKRMIAEICAKTGVSLPEEYYISTPPKTDTGYMANLEQKERVARIVQRGIKITTQAPRYDERQVSLL